MILKRESLDKYLVKDDELNNAIATKTLIEYLNAKREEYYDLHNGTVANRVKESGEAHHESMKFIDSLLKNNSNDIVNFLLKQNRGGGVVLNGTMILMDATGSMSHLLNGAKAMVATMFKRTFDLLADHKLPPSSIMIKIAVYRNYNSTADKLLETSGWENNAVYLSSFLNGIHVDGGWGNEAMEVALYDAANEAEFGRVSQVLVIGDAPPNTAQEVTHRRNSDRGQAYWSRTKFAEQRLWSTEVNRLVDRDVPIHTFYVDNDAKKAFEEIARLSKGTSQVKLRLI
jgi:hypothetical protein